MPLSEEICGSASEKELHILGCIVGKTLGLYAAQSLGTKEPLLTMQGGTFALECTHIPLGPPPASTGAAEWQNATILTLKNAPH